MIPGLNDIKRIYFIGIGGIGMSAIARYFLAHEVQVSGYDRTPTELTRQLEIEGASIQYEDHVSVIDKEVQLVVYTPAVPASHAGLSWYRQNNYPVVKRSDVLKIITDASFNICVAGTHGKTSISTMIGHLLRHSGYGCNAFLGGVSVNYHTNFWGAPNDVCVVEADEFDRSFLKLWPDIAVVTSIDADHLDIYGTAEKMEDAFLEFIGQIKPTGLLISKHGLKRLDEAGIRRQWSYQLNPVDNDHQHAAPDVFARGIKTADGRYWFDAVVAGETILGINMLATGWHNLENMLAAIAVAKALKVDDEKIKAAVADYKGVKRRFEYWWNGEDKNGKRLVFIDDYAHHPEELRALLIGAKSLFPDLPCSIVFQPHLFSRTKDHAAAFGNILSMADEVVLLPIYPARELPMPGVSSAIIAEHMDAGKVRLMEKQEWMHTLESGKSGLLLTAGAGDIDVLLPEVLKKLTGAIEQS